ncbi:MAG: ORF6N domain-containing protein [Candidatus Binatia bacterium]
MAGKKITVPLERIERLILVIRGQKIILSTDLAELYDVEPRVLVQAVKRNLDRFPPDFMFQLTKAEFANLKSQIVISNWGGIWRATPYAFTEQGVAMLSSLLNSKRAVEHEPAQSTNRMRTGQITDNCSSIPIALSSIPLLTRSSVGHNF